LPTIHPQPCLRLAGCHVCCWVCGTWHWGHREEWNWTQRRRIRRGRISDSQTTNDL